MSPAGLRRRQTAAAHVVAGWARSRAVRAAPTPIPATVRYRAARVATAVAVITSILFIALRSWWLLGAGLVAALMMFIVVLFIPTHLLENPLRHARGIRPHALEPRDRH